MTNKYYTNYIEKKGKYVNCKDLPPKYISNNTYFYLINKYFTNLLF